MADKNNYHDEITKQNILKMRELLKQLPSFCREYFIGIQESTSARTRLGYAYDLHLFFEYLHKENPVCAKMEITDFKIDILEMLTRQDIEEFLNYITYYVKEDGRELTNDERGKARKLSALKSMYNYFFQCEKITKNPPALVRTPKIHEKEIVRLEANEVALLLEQTEDGAKLTKKEKEYHEKTKVRDVAIITLLLGTGIRVSECVGIDIQDIDFNVNGIKIRRKGGNETVIYFGDEVEQALLDYLEERDRLIPYTGHENALFLSMQMKRISVRSVEKLVKKYASRSVALKKITPHKLRSTFGTALYQQTGDIYLVADVLGHKDVNTTRAHYAAQDEQRKRQAANVVKLRED